MAEVDTNLNGADTKQDNRSPDTPEAENKPQPQESSVPVEQQAVEEQPPVSTDVDDTQEADVGGLPPKPEGDKSKTTYDAMKEKSLGLSTYIKQKATAVQQQIKQVDFKKLTETAGERLSQVLNSGRKQIQKLRTGPALDTQCKIECQSRPVPRIALQCCTYIVASGTDQEGIFRDPVSSEILDSLTELFLQNHSSVLFPPGTTPQIASQFLKHYLVHLPEPILTYQRIPLFIQAVKDLENLNAIVISLPPVNLNTLQLLLDTCSRIAGDQDKNQTTPTILAQSLAPALAWHPLQKEGDPPIEDPESIRSLPLEPQELRSIEVVLEYLIANYAPINV